VEKQSSGQSQTGVGKFGRVFWTLAFAWLLLPVSLTVWFIWEHRLNLAETVVQTSFYVAFTWGVVSTFQCYRTLQLLGLSGEGRKQLFSGPRPDDPDEQRAWEWGRQFLLAFIAVLLCMLAIPFLW
jgi:hypothetical protein